MNADFFLFAFICVYLRQILPDLIGYVILSGF